MATPAPSAIVELLKPITWFAPMWAFGCGVISSGQTPSGQWLVIAAGVLLAGPLVCATSQAANDWFDRHVDAINEPDRPIPSGRIPGRWGLYLAAGWTVLSLVVAALLGPWILGAALFGLVLAWIYSAPPFRLKQNGWWGNSAVALCYEGLPWFTGAAVMAASMPDRRVLLVALLYSVGAHGIMTLNDFKSVEGDRAMGLRSLPVQLGSDRAARFACLVMAVPQVVVVALLLHWERPWHAALIGALLAGQLVLMTHFLKAPRARAAWYNGTGTTLYVFGMLAAAFALRPLVQGLAP
ncbi:MULTISPECIES: chlorophyll synthase ChlG [Methylorubrum]|uniref:chlorophyll synthase ChlG n=1 Tax=Methylorubrum TaxID=2282523 RepID=UPI00209C8E26|nr:MULTISPECIES: chlorophyll synthase ChlG [Methylorubrum]MCP1550872.1 chlorophyll synthase [Methylorubrum zatmanii]MCP1552515.1 chlorophyll synthase [Methylorubrum extorquens]MCP1581175.1 chlorophyll synthase [Methylorubrum extorquens]